MKDTTTEALDREDMVRLAGGHDASLNHLMERHGGKVFQFLLRMVGNEDDARDLAQETFVRVYRSRARFNPAQTFTSWLFTIAANLARNHARWRSRHPGVSLEMESGEGQSLRETIPAGSEHPAQAAQSSERAQAVRHAVRNLPDDLREAVVLCEWEDLSLADAAAIAGTTAKAIESRLYRARKLLRDSLQSWL
jgi:RNA polymerase sigma-70 factor, ECF subfamily